MKLKNKIIFNLHNENGLFMTKDYYEKKLSEKILIEANIPYLAF